VGVHIAADRRFFRKLHGERRRPRQRRSPHGRLIRRRLHSRSIGDQHGQIRTRPKIQGQRGQEVQERTGPAAY
jgi:hypothetical protein